MEQLIMNFKINAKYFLITYPRCTLSPEEVLQALQDVAPLRNYTICKELHEDGTPHIHACVIFDKRVHRTNPRCFDVAAHHPNIKPLPNKTSYDQARCYVTKDGEFITNVQETLGKRAQLAKELLEEGKITKKFILEHPEVIYLNHSSVTCWLNYFKSPIEIPQTLNKRRHIWLSGPSNSGKTHWLRAYLQMSTIYAEIPDNSDHRDFDLETTVAYADEYRGQHTVQYLNKLCDGYTQLNTKGGSTRIASLIVVICSNFTIRETFPKISDTIYDSLINRFHQYDSSFKLPPLPIFII